MHAVWNESTIERMTDFWTEDGDWIWEDLPDLPDAQVLRGRDAVTERLRELTSLFGGMTIQDKGMTMIGDEVLVDVLFTAEGTSSGVQLDDIPIFHLIRLEDGRVRRYRSFRTREAALAAASISQ